MTSNTPDRSRTRFPGISSRAYEHPADRSALVALRSLSGFDTVLRRLAGLFSERAIRLMFLGGTVRAGERQYRHIHDIVRDGAYILDLPKVPEVYVTQDPAPNAMTIGVDNPFIVLNTGLIDLLDDEELRFVIGHEVGHVLSGHAVYRTMAMILTNLGARIAWLPFGNIAIAAILMGLNEWQRKSELSADRAGLLAGQDVEAGKRALMKLAGGARLSEMDGEAFLEQAREYDAAGDVRDGLLKFLNLLNRSHPYAVIRFSELDHWARDGEYARILGGDYERRADDGSASISEEIKNAANAYRESWSRSADPFIGTVKGVAEGAVNAGERLFGRFTRGGEGGEN
ncbi:M48 family metallopeptidase [Actinoallomurus rhizosphaericola]|uniref:M48 family metallopeptidase n=1 Tax=Actinoallomurus rhizosphaericola TaxID=2952536 RepID=UPI0020908125|nr:M48 family metallopeptidase [Actinoallomurus rhizosphaericola]MCO5993847.1 M48 family metallopeptidase [Actinoallomurus rhizosphaericola]